MKKVKALDITIDSLNRLTNEGTFATVEDIITKTKLERHLQLRILEYLVKSNYCENNSNAYKITFEGEYYIDKTIFPFRNRPFLADKIYKLIKFMALLSNTLLVLLLGVLNYQINKDREKEAKNTKIETENDKDNNVNKIKKDTVNLISK